MNPICALAFCSFVLSLVLTPLCRDFARRHDLMDQPDQHRKVHQAPVPRIGGVAIMVAVALSMCILGVTPFRSSQFVAAALPFAFRVLPGLLLVFLAGLADDLFGLRPWQKLAAEIAASVYLCLGGVQIHSIATYQLSAWFSVPLTLLWLVGCTNAVNLIDGLDGLATGVGLFATLTIMMAALLQGNSALALATAPLMGALCGFLRYNFNPASVFLGDCGSLSIGFLLGSFGIIWSQKSATMLGMTAPLMALAVPFIDTVLAIVRRALRGRPIFGGDRRHIHHRLLDRGFTPRRVALVLYGLCGVSAALSLLLSVVHGTYAGLIIVLFCTATWVGIQHLGYVEFHVAGRLILPRTFQRIIDAQVRLRTLEEQLRGARDLDQCWDALLTATRNLGFSSLRMRFDHYLRSATWGKTDAPSWTLRIRLSDNDFVEIGHEFGAPVAPTVVAPLADLLHRSLQSDLRPSPSGDPLNPSSLIALSALAGSKPEKRRKPPVREYQFLKLSTTPK